MPDSTTDPIATDTATSQPGWVRRLWGYMMLHRRDLSLGLTAAALSSVCLTVVPLVERQIVDTVIVTHTSSLWPWLVLLVGLPMPAGNAEIVKLIAAGFLGALTQGRITGGSQ